MSAQEMQGDFSIQHLCGLGGVSRAGFYRHSEVSAPERTEADLRDKIQKTASTAIGESAGTSGASTA